MPGMLDGKNAVVTGSGRGIGREIALAFARAGAKVVVNDYGVARDGTGKDTSPADTTVADIKKGGGAAVANYDSVSDFAGAGRIIKTCIDNFGRIDILANVAGFLREKMIFNMPEEDWDAVIGVHLKGTFNCTRHAVPYMREQKAGRVINTASPAWLGTVGQSGYGAAKGGIMSFTWSIARELGRYGITCNCIVPMAATRMTMDEGVKAGWRKRYETGLITKEHLERLLATPGPEYVPPMAVYLASDKAADINGQAFRSEAECVGIYTKPFIEKAIYRDYLKDGPWKPEELADMVPRLLLVNYINPAPRQDDKPSS